MTLANSIQTRSCEFPRKYQITGILIVANRETCLPLETEARSPLRSSFENAFIAPIGVTSTVVFAHANIDMVSWAT